MPIGKEAWMAGSVAGHDGAREVSRASSVWFDQRVAALGSYLIAITTGPETGSVVPRPLPRSSRVGRKRSRVAIIRGRPDTSASWLSHSAMMQ